MLGHGPQAACCASVPACVFAQQSTEHGDACRSWVPKHVLLLAACASVSCPAGNVNAQVAEVCRQLGDLQELRGGFNMVGMSQGGQFLRVSVAASTLHYL
jgi:hypothetical protein